MLNSAPPSPAIATTGTSRRAWAAPIAVAIPQPSVPWYPVDKNVCGSYTSSAKRDTKPIWVSSSTNNPFFGSALRIAVSHDICGASSWLICAITFFLVCTICFCHSLRSFCVGKPSSKSGSAVARSACSAMSARGALFKVTSSISMCITLICSSSPHCFFCAIRRVPRPITRSQSGHKA